MHPASPFIAPSASPEQQDPSTKHEAGASGAASCELLVRVSRVLHDMNAGREVTDAEILQHQADCRQLFEKAHALWKQGCESREVVEQWQACFLEAGRCLSPQWKAAREAAIQRQIDDGVGYFVDQGDRDRLALARMEAERGLA